jgi:hypothetical protein
MPVRRMTDTVSTHTTASSRPGQLLHLRHPKAHSAGPYFLRHKRLITGAPRWVRGIQDGTSGEVIVCNVEGTHNRLLQPPTRIGLLISA